MASEQEHGALCEFIDMGRKARPGPWVLRDRWIRTQDEQIKWNADGAISKSQYSFNMHPRICRPMRQTNEDKANVPFILRARDLHEPLLAVIREAREIANDLQEELEYSCETGRSEAVDEFLERTAWATGGKR